MAALVGLSVVQRRIAFVRSEEAASAYNHWGDLSLKADRPQAAERLLTLAIQRQPKLALAYANRAGARRQLSRLPDALADADQAIELDPSLAYAHMNRGNILRELGRWAEARQAYERSLELDARSAPTFLNRAMLHEAQGDLKGAHADLDRAIELDPTFALAHSNRGSVRERLNDPLGALADFQAAIRLGPTLPTAFDNLGIFLLHHGEQPQAITQAVGYLSRAIELDLDDPGPYKARGDAYGKLGETALARRDYDAAIRLDPGYVDALINRGALSVFDQPEQALADFREAERLAPERVSVHTNIGVALTELKRYPEALEHYARAIQLDPKDWLPWNNRGLAHDQMGNVQAALDDFARALELAPSKTDQAEVASNRGSVFFGKDRLAEAVAEYSRSIELDPRRAQSLVNRGIALAKLNQYSAAIADFTRAVEINPQQVEAYIYRATAYSDTNQPLKALDDFGTAIRLGPRDANLYNNRGNLLKRLGNSRRRLPTTRLPSPSTRNCRSHSTAGPTRTCTRNSSIKRSPTSTVRSNSILNRPAITTCAARCSARWANRTRRWPRTARPSASIPPCRALMAIAARNTPGARIMLQP